jgi:hypothetical protein
VPGDERVAVAEGLDDAAESCISDGSSNELKWAMVVPELRTNLDLPL